MKIVKLVCLLSCLILLSNCGGKIAININDNPAPDHVIIGTLLQKVKIMAFATVECIVKEGNESYIDFYYINTQGVIKLPKNAINITLHLEAINPYKQTYDVVKQFSYVEKGIKYLRVDTIYYGKLSKNSINIRLPINKSKCHAKISINVDKTQFTIFDLSYNIDIENKYGEVET